MEMKRDQIFVVPLCTQLQMNKSVRKLSFPFICCKSTYKEHIRFSQILLCSLLKFTPYLLQSSPEKRANSKAKITRKFYPRTWGHCGHCGTNHHAATACSGVSAAGCTSHRAFKSQHHEASQDITSHWFQPSAVCAAKDEDQEVKQSVCSLHACNSWNGNTQRESEGKGKATRETLI